MRKKQYIFLSFLFCFGLCCSAFFGAPAVDADTVLFDDPFFRGVGRLEIANGADTVHDRRVIVYVKAPFNAREMQLSHRSDFRDVSDWVPVREHTNFVLEEDTNRNRSFNRNRRNFCVYVRFRDMNHAESKTFSDCVKLVVPSGKFVDFKIDDGAEFTHNRDVTLDIDFSRGVEMMEISNSSDFSGFSKIFVQQEYRWRLSPGNGKKTVYIRFSDANGNAKTISKSITLVHPGGAVPDGTIVKGDSSSVYYVGFDGKLHPFVNGAVYHSWFQDFSDVKYVGDRQLQQYEIGAPVPIRPGTWLVKFSSSARIYAVEPGYQLRPVRSEAEAAVLFGRYWHRRIVELDDLQRPFYSIRNEFASIFPGNDRDSDGVKTDVEQLYGSSDRKLDSDNDGVSDHEEIFYWFSNPIDRDTDNDGIRDGKEITNGYPPFGPARFTQVPADSYHYPYGSLIRNQADGMYYYYHSDGDFYFVGDTLSDAFRSNHFQAQFVTTPLVALPFTANPQKVLAGSRVDVAHPTVFDQGGLIPL